MFNANERLLLARGARKPEYLRYFLGPLGVRNYEMEEDRPAQLCVGMAFACFTPHHL